MKLYTEKDIANAVMFGRWGGTTKKEYEDFLKKLTPIELPSDEEIKTYLNNHSYEFEHGFKDAIEFIKNKIQGGNK